MNDTDRKEIEAIVADLASQRDFIEEIGEREQNKFDNLPDGLQATPMGEALEQASERIQEALASFDECVDTLSQLAGGEA